MKKVLIVMTTLYNGGAERSLINFINELSEDKYKIDLLLFKKEGMFLSQVPDDVNILDTPANLNKLYGKLNDAGNLLLIKLFGTAISNIFTENSREKRGFRWKYFYSRCIDKLPGHYDVAIAYISGEVLYYVNEKIDADKKIVWVHSDYRSMKHPRKFDYPHFKNMDYIVSISELCVDILKDEFPDLSNKMVMIPNLTSSQFVTKSSKEYEPMEFQKNTFNILSVGRLTDVKGFDIAIKAAKVLKNSNINFTWFVIGTGELKEDLTQKIADDELVIEFILLGARENPYPYIKNCDIFVQPSRHEGKSVVLDEAKILSKPIVATNYPTVRDQLSDKEGLIVDISPEGIAQGIIEMLDDNKRQQYSEYLSEREYGNQKEINLYYKVIDN